MPPIESVREMVIAMSRQRRSASCTCDEASCIGCEYGLRSERGDMKLT